MRILAGIGLMLALGACAALNPEAATPTPTWSFSAPTLEATRRPLDARPTESRAPLLSVPGQNNPTAAALPADSQLPPRVLGTSESGVKAVQMPLTSGVILSGTLYENPPIQLEDRIIASRLPGVLLIGVPTNAWGDLPEQLRLSGFTVLVVDMGLNDTSADFSDVLDALSRLGSVNPGAIAVIGASDGADQALIGCAVDDLCDALVLLSPLAGDTLVNLMADYNPRPIFIAAGSDDGAAYETAQRLAQVAAGPIELRLLIDGGRSTQMLQNQPELGQDIADWLSQWLAG